MSNDVRLGFLTALRQAARVDGFATPLAFLRWYIGARFGPNAQSDVTDGPNDGGIDAIVTEQRPNGRAVYVLQSKFHEAYLRGRGTPLPISDYLSFDAIPARFGTDIDFDEWLGTVDHGLVGRYRDLRRAIRNNHTDVKWQLITTHSRSRKGEDRLQNLVEDDFVYGAQLVQLFQMSQEGAAPPADSLDLNFTRSMTVEDPVLGLTSYVLAATLKDFIDFLDHDPEERLFARNVRLDLRSKINQKIKATYLNAPHEFWHSHNGITVICTKATIQGQRIRLVHPSVINGSQTLHALKGVPSRNPDAQVLTRVLVVKTSGDHGKVTKQFVNDVIFRMNQQNPMKASNLRANDPIQVDLARRFAPFKVFYERREAEWATMRRIRQNQGFRRLRSRELAQILAACSPEYGPAAAKGKIDRLFEEPAYGKLFYQGFPEVLLRYQIGRFADWVVWDTKIRGTKPRQRRQAHWTVLHVVFETLRRSPAFRHLVGHPAIQQHLDRSTDNAELLWELCASVLRDSWSAWAQANRRDRQLDPNNFFKTEGYTKKLTPALIRKHRKRGDRAVRALLAPAQ